MRKNICVILSCILCVITTISFAVDNVNNTNTTNNTNNSDVNNSIATELQNKQKEVQEQLNQANEELSELKLDITDNLEQVQKLDEKIEIAEKELQETSERVQVLQQTIKGLQEIQDSEEEKYEDQKAIFEKRVVALYEAGETQYLDVILNSKSISEFISTYYLVAEIAECDSEILNSIAERKNNIEITKTKLEKEKKEMATLIERQTRTSKVLQVNKALRENYINQLTEQEQETQVKVDEYNRVLAQVNAQLVELAKQGIETQYIGGELAWPVPGYTKISSPYGMRVHPITKAYKLHTGVDISAPMGANFVAANDGIVIKAEYNVAYGKMVVIDHGGGISTLYAHGSQILVEVGQQVTRNQAVLKVGSTGYSTGPHAHFEVRKNGVVTNPMPYITSGVVPNSEEDKKQEKEENNNTNNTSNTNTNVENTTIGNKTH